MEITRQKNRRKFYPLLSIWLWLVALPVFPQTDPIYYTDVNWVGFSSTDPTLIDEVFTVHRDFFMMGPYDNMELVSVRTSDEDGFSHLRYKQTYNGVEVAGPHYTVHGTGGHAVTANGFFMQGLSVDMSASLDENAALEAALYDMTQYLTGTYGVVSDSVLYGTDTSGMPQVKQMVTKLPDEEDIPENYRLYYLVKIECLKPVDENYLVYIDAQTGASTIVISKMYSTTGQVTTLYNGWRNLETKWTGSITKYKLIDDSRGNGIHTRKIRSGSDQYKNDADNNWDDSYEKKIHASTHWAAQVVWDYYANTHGRSGPDGNGMTLDILTDKITSSVKNECDPSSNPLKMDFVDPEAGICDPRVSVNAVGHEFTHGVLHHEANMNVSTMTNSTSESYALMEGYCDIFAEFAEFYLQGWVDWRYDEESLIDNNYVRKFDFSDEGSSLCYGNAQWYASPDGHYRGGVLRHWVYLLSSGGSGTNCHNNDYCVTGLGIQKVGQITYKVIYDGYIGPSSSYNDMRNACITVSNQLYGANSHETAQVTSAWYAVGVGANYSGTINVINQTITGTATYAYNNKVSVSNFTAANGSNVTITSNTEIEMLPDNMQAENGSVFSAYIAPGCWGGAMPQYQAPYQEGPDGMTESGLAASVAETNTSEPDYLLYPNPSNGQFRIELSPQADLPSSIVIEDMLGNQVFGIARPAAYTYDFNLEGISAGIYLVKVNYGTRPVIKKVIRN